MGLEALKNTKKDQPDLKSASKFGLRSPEQRALLFQRGCWSNPLAGMLTVHDSRQDIISEFKSSALLSSLVASVVIWVEAASCDGKM